MPRTATPSTCCCSRRTRTSASSSRPLAFDLADRLQTPIFVMTRSRHRHEPLAVRAVRRGTTRRDYDRGKVMTADELEAGKDFGRYMDVDGDGIPYRTLSRHAPDARARSSPAAPPRTATPATREEGADYIYNMERLLRKFETARTISCRSRCCRARTSRRAAASIYFGSTSPAMAEALDVLEAAGHPRRRAAHPRASRSTTR